MSHVDTGEVEVGGCLVSLLTSGTCSCTTASCSVPCEPQDNKPDDNICE